MTSEYFDDLKQFCKLRAAWKANENPITAAAYLAARHEILTEHPQSTMGNILKGDLNAKISVNEMLQNQINGQ